MNPSQQQLLRTYSAAGAFPIVPPLAESQMLAVLYQLEQSQWWTAEQLLEAQFQQLALLLQHADKEILFYRQRLRQAGMGDGQRLTLEAWQRLPILTRSDFQGREGVISTSNVPAPCQVSGMVATSGSTAQPIRVSTTNLTQFLWNVFTLREHQWHGLDFSRKLAAIRYVNHAEAAYPHGAHLPQWGPPAAPLYRTGPSSLLDSKTTTAAQQWEWLTREKPDYLVTYPSILAELIAHSIGEGQRPPGLREIRLFGETVDEGLRTLCREAWKIPLTDTYSANEAGPIAFQCPEQPCYHVQAENLFVEILNEQNQACAPGEIGRVVITTLHNFATPLIRYFIGDYAEVGAACACGRGLPVLKRILGRARNLLSLPTGEKRWPVLGWGKLSKIVPLTQYQMIQKSVHEVEARLVVRGEVTAEQEEKMKTVVQASLGYPFEVTFSYPPAIERSAAGKFEDFRSEVV